MADKKAETYKEVFGRIQLMITKEPEIIILDFELAQYTALASVWKNIKIFFCLFHFGQCVFRQIQKLGLAAEYKENQSTKYVKC